MIMGLHYLRGMSGPVSACMKRHAATNDEIMAKSHWKKQQQPH